MCYTPREDGASGSDVGAGKGVVAGTADALRRGDIFEADLTGCESLAGSNGDELWAAMREAGGPLRSLVLSNCGCDDEGASAMAAALSAGSCTGLTELDASYNAIGDSGCDRLCSALAEGCPGLRDLYLSHNPWSDVDCVVALVRRATALRKLQLDACKVGDGGAVKLAAALFPEDGDGGPGATALTSLELVACGVGDGGARALSRAVARSGGTLAAVNLAGCDDVSGGALAELSAALAASQREGSTGGAGAAET